MPGRSDIRGKKQSSPSVGGLFMWGRKHRVVDRVKDNTLEQTPSSTAAGKAVVTMKFTL